MRAHRPGGLRQRKRVQERGHDPELLDKILTSNEKNEQIKAMKAGKQQYEREQFLKELEQAKEKQNDKA